MINAAIIGAQTKLVLDFLNTNPSEAKSVEQARFAGKMASALDILAKDLGFGSRQEFDKRYTDVAMEQIAGLVASGPGFGGMNVSREDFAPVGVQNSGRSGPEGRSA